jgi:thimet oligopeptidase
MAEPGRARRRARQRLIGACWAAAIGLAAATPAGARGLPEALQYDGATIAARCDGELEKYRRTKAAMERPSAPGSILAEWNQLSISVADFVYPVYLLQNVATERATRDAAQACLEKLLPFSTELMQSERLYRRVEALKPRDAIDASYRASLLEQFEDNGVSLPPERRARVRAIREELEKLDLAFSKNIHEESTVVPVAEVEAHGLPAEWIAARKRDEEGRLLVTLDYPTYASFMANAVGEDARRRVWTARQNEGGERNLALLDRVLALRQELARVYELPDYASFALRRRMAQTPAAVFEFLDRVKRTVDEVEAKDLAELRADKAALLGRSIDSVTLERWDVSFHQERVRRARYRIDQEALRANFPTDASIRYSLRLAELLYGLSIVEREAPRWHADVRYYEVFERGADGARGAFVGSFLLDLYPRDGKYNHAAVFTVRETSTHAGRKPVAAMVANFSRNGLNHEELETLLHEFGHVLHAVLARTRYADQAGSVRRDFVEAPSQMFEEWARREEPLGLLAELCNCPRLDAAQIARLDQARRFGSGLLYARQWQYAMYDMLLHSGAVKPALATWIDLERRSRLGYVEGTIFPAGFTHLMNYAAGYYGYLWSQVLALDMLSPFGGKLLNPEVGRRYRQAILSQGSQRPPQALVEAFLGRKPGSEAFFLEITGKR